MQRYFGRFHKSKKLTKYKKKCWCIQIRDAAIIPWDIWPRRVNKIFGGACMHCTPKLFQAFPELVFFARPVCQRNTGPFWKSTHSAVFNRCCYLYVVVLLPTGGWIWNCRDWVGRLGKGGERGGGGAGCSANSGLGNMTGGVLGKYSTLPESWGRSIGTLVSTHIVLFFKSP